MSTLHPEAEALLNGLAEAGVPPFEHMTVPQARNAAQGFLPLQGAPNDVASVINDSVPTASGDIPVRIITPLGEGPFPVIVYDVCASRLLTARRAFDGKRNNHINGIDADFLVQLVQGTMSTNMVLQDAVAYGLRTDVEYFVVRGRPGPGYTAKQLRDETQTQTWLNDHSGVVVVVDDDVLGLVPRYPAEITRGVVAVGASTGLFEAAYSNSCASRALETAIQFGLTGVVTQEDLSLRLAILSEPEINEILIDRYFGPLVTEGDFGVVLESTIGEYLDSGAELKRAARSLHVHPNTLKHRLLRFQDLTKCNLSNPKTLAELWWAVEARAVRPGLVRG